MELKIQAIRFNATEKLAEFIEKKLGKLAKSNDDIAKAEVVLTVVKPESANNKSVAINVSAPGAYVHVEKICDTFEEGVDLCVDVLKRQLAKHKEKKTGK